MLFIFFRYSAWALFVCFSNICCALQECELLWLSLSLSLLPLLYCYFRYPVHLLVIFVDAFFSLFVIVLLDSLSSYFLRFAGRLFVLFILLRRYFLVFSFSFFNISFFWFCFFILCVNLVCCCCDITDACATYCNCAFYCTLLSLSN